MNGEYHDLLDVASNFAGDYLESVHYRSVFPENFAIKSLSLFDKSLLEQSSTAIECDLTPHELNIADEMFLTGPHAEIVVVGKFNGRS